MGVRTLVFDDQGRVLMVEHTYLAGWSLPGGGVDRGETLEAAARRELMEEAGVDALSRPVLISIHSNEARFRGDHVALFRIDHWRHAVHTPDPREIRAIAFFAPDALPEDTMPGSRRRIAEALGGGVADAMW